MENPAKIVANKRQIKKRDFNSFLFSCTVLSLKMVRTKADTTGVKASGAKAPRKALSSTPTRSVSSESDGKNKTHGGGNSYHPRETPGWQKPITTFFVRPQPESCSNSEEQTSSETVSPNSDN